MAAEVQRPRQVRHDERSVNRLVVSYIFLARHTGPTLKKIEAFLHFLSSGLFGCATPHERRGFG